MITIKELQGVSSRGVVYNFLDCDIEVFEFKLQSQHIVYFLTKTHAKCITSRIFRAKC